MAGAARLVRGGETGGPEPTTATRRPVSNAGAGTTQPSSKRWSMIAFSTCLIVTASPSLISSTHAASHGAEVVR